MRAADSMSEGDTPDQGLSVLYEDEALIVIDKPPKRLVHRSPLEPRDRPVMGELRDQIGTWVYPVHRLDRATSGLLLFARSAEVARLICAQFEARAVKKSYAAIVRGHLEGQQKIDHPLKEPRDRIADALVDPDKARQSAVSWCTACARAELPIPIGRYSTARYSLVSLSPETGRRHQLRRHMHLISHPIIGDTSYGKGEHNRLFRREWGCDRLLLAATSLQLQHPLTGALLLLSHAPEGVFSKVSELLFGAGALTQLLLRQRGLLTEDLRACEEI